MQKIILHHAKHFEAWDYRNIDVGIGGSETHQIEMSWRLAEMGYQVISYAPIPEDCQRYNLGVEWRHLDEVDFVEDGLWVIYRSPEYVDRLDGQKAWLIMQDVDYLELTEERASRFDKIIALCVQHADYLATMKPYLRKKLFISSNGIRSLVIEQIEKECQMLETFDPETRRNPHRIMYASSPDRGLINCLDTFQQARRYIPDLQFHLFYGFDNIDKVIARGSMVAKALKDEIMEKVNQDGVFWHGRIAQTELYKEWLKSGIWLYQTNFFETSCITCMEAQSLGAIPITRPFGALADNVKHGIFIHGDCTSGDNKARYMAELINLAGSPSRQEEIRKSMMVDARERFNWDRIAKQWGNWIDDTGKKDNRDYRNNDRDSVFADSVC